MFDYCVNCYLQYDFRSQNETAIREEMVDMANLLDGVRFSVFGRRTDAWF